MAADVLPDEIIVRDRQDFIASQKAAYLAKRPNDLLNDGTFQHAIFCAVADVCVMHSLNARTIGRSIPLQDVSGLRLDQRLAALQLPPRFGEIGSSGFVTVSTSVGGATISEGDRLTEASSNAVFEAAESDTYEDGAAVPIRAVTTGPATNLPSGTVLTWSSPSSGLSPICKVQEHGLQGGRLAESDEQVRLRISDAMADPAASGNAATYITLAERSQAHGVPVQKAFAYLATSGPGTIGLAFLLTPGGPGTSRIPSSAQIAQVREYVLTVPDDTTRVPPGDDLLFDTTLLSQPVTIVVDVRWGQRAANWMDAARWPVRHARGEGAIVVSAALDATHFTLARDSGSYSGEPQPANGQTIAFYDKRSGTFARKRIASVTGNGPWVITVDTSNNSSDMSYIPAAGQRVCPWSESLDDLVRPILDYFEKKIGPGEQFPQAELFDPGARLKRTPFSPESWPATTTNHLASALLDLPAVGNAIIREGLGVTAATGVPGTTAHLLELEDIVAFPLS